MLARTCRNSWATASRWARFTSTTAPKASAPTSAAAAVPIDPVETSQQDLAEHIVHGRSVHAPYYHPRTHNIPAALLHFRSYHPELLQLFTHFATHAASSLGIPVSKPASLPTQRSMWTVPRGPFAHKKSQENFERRTHKRAIKAWDADPEVVERWVRYLEAHMMGGVGMRVVRWERAPVGVGKKILDTVKSGMRGVQENTVEEKVKALGDKIVQQELAAAKADSTVQVLTQKSTP